MNDPRLHRNGVPSPVELALAAARSGPIACTNLHLVGGETGQREPAIALLLSQTVDSPPVAMLLLTKPETLDELADKIRGGAHALREQLAARAAALEASEAERAPEQLDAGAGDVDAGGAP